MKYAKVYPLGMELSQAQQNILLRLAKGSKIGTIIDARRSRAFINMEKINYRTFQALYTKGCIYRESITKSKDYCTEFYIISTIGSQIIKELKDEWPRRIN